MKLRKKKAVKLVALPIPTCSYCDKIPVQDIYVCEDHLKALEKVASRRKQ